MIRRTSPNTSDATAHPLALTKLLKDPIVKAAFEKQAWEQHLRNERHRLQVRHQRSLFDFVCDAWPVVEPSRALRTGWMLKDVCRHLEAVSSGELVYLLITIPPGMMKSLLLNVFWPAWEWGALNRPGLKFIGASYKQSQAKRDGRKMRLLVESKWYQRIYGDRVQLASHADESFENTTLGYRKSLSLGSLTGERADRVLVDDPHNIFEVESDVQRDGVVQNFTENVLNRVNDAETSAIVVIMQRVHEKDVAGEILARELEFVHLNLPMLFDPKRACSTPIGFTDPRTVEGELLFPELISLAAVERYRRRMGEYAFSAQYQQAPVNREGNYFKRSWFRTTEQPPARAKRFSMAWDLAATEPAPGKDPDYTVGVLAALDEAGDIWIMNIYRAQKSLAPRNAFIRQAVVNAGTDVRQLFSLDPGQAGKDQEVSIKQLLDFHHDVRFEPARKSKAQRAEPAMLAAEMGRIHLCKFKDRDTFLDEICAFPGGAHDDIVDAFADVVRDLLKADNGYDLSAVG